MVFACAFVNVLTHSDVYALSEMFEVPWPGLLHCIMFLGKTPCSYTASLHPGI